MKKYLLENACVFGCKETEDKTHFVKKFLNIVSYYIPKFKHPHRKFFVFVPGLINISKFEMNIKKNLRSKLND